MTKKITFVLGLHNHQPVGNPSHVIERTFQQAYFPFLQVLESHPAIKVTLHYSGFLLRWISQTHPELLDLLRKLIQRNQVEIKTGGFYEPILPIIPDEDKIAQIEKLTDFIRSYLDYSPRGLWLAERVWEPHLAKSISEAGVEYVVVDDSHFRACGFRDDEMMGYYVTEEQGVALKVFPTSMRLRYLIPFEKPGGIIDYLRTLAAERVDRLAIIDDDGEKFGGWPKTYHHVYQEGWLENFFTLLEKNADWIDTLTFSQCIDKFNPWGRAYLPTASYSELMEWALPTPMALEYERIIKELKEAGMLQRYQPFLKGSFWRNFLVKYPESNNMHKKMLYVSKKVHQTDDSEALEELWHGQCNDAYWHGVFGGLYLFYLRFAIYQHLIRAETLTERKLHKTENWAEVESTDFDKDGLDEVLISTPKLNLYFDPGQGGTLFELDFKPKAVNVLNTMTRRPETYHEKILLAEEKKKVGHFEAKTIHEIERVGKEKLKPYLHYDWYRRVSLIDHFLSPNDSLKSFQECSYQELGDFVERPYQAEIICLDPPTILLERKGTILYQSSHLPISIQKKIQVKKEHSLFNIGYEIINLGNQDLNLWFGVEFNFSLFHNELLDVREKQDVSVVEIKDTHQKISIDLQFDRNALLWQFPIETVSQSEEGFEKVYQSSVLLPSWRFVLQPEDVWKVRIVQKIEEIK